MLNHADCGRTSEFVGQGGVGREVAPPTEMDADDKLENLTAEEEPGYGLGLPGLASLTLPSDGMVVPPLNFSMVSVGVFRSGYPIACNFPFLRRLGLQSILCLCPESVLPGSLEWAKESGVSMEMCDLGENSPPFVSMPLAAMRKAVDYLSDCRNRPVLVHCLTGKTQTGCAIGCLRRRQNWALGAIFDEYTRFAGPSAKPLDMQFIELFE
ncbi:unnamed protein product [Ectocarpus sp. CCAP 1310/34]|nr:unnamed protein product [Ectocarpus sp. CCAP 1310/34]